MGRLTPLITVAALAICAAGCGGGGDSETGNKILAGHAEDLWGNPIDLSDYSHGLTILHPFSPADCGYCLFDGEFADANYGLNTLELGGAYFGVCLFSPQIDIYAYSKHYRESNTIIISPPDLHRYHRDGFPWLTAFKDGEKIFADGMSPYETTFKGVRVEFWGADVPLRPTSCSQMASRFVWENHDSLAVVVIPDGEPMPERVSDENYTTKHESDLTADDLRKNLLIAGPSGRLKLDFLKGAETPVEITDETFAIGDYEFPRSETGLAACFPNPRDPERYVMLKTRGAGVKAGLYQNWVDYTVYKNTPEGTPQVLMDGLFERDGGRWRYSRGKAWLSDETMSFCKGGKCPAPFEAEPAAAKPPYEAPAPARSASEHGELWTLGGSKCRFPHLCTDGRGGCEVVWEEDGDIVLAKLPVGAGAGAGAASGAAVFPIEEGRWDSYNPLVAVCGEDTWVFYLNDQDGFYRLYGAYGRPGGAFNEVLLSGEGALDSFSPGVVAAGPGKLTVAWSEWKANLRYLMYRTIDGRVLGETKQAAIKSSDIDYTNAWYPSLAADGEGRVWGAWNQHYPQTLGVCAGDLVHEAASVSEEFGGYPSLAIDRSGVRWVFWESYMRNVVLGKPHRILAAYCENDGSAWSLPDDLSAAAGCEFNHTPKAVVDADGVMWVAWSGRRDLESPWGIYLLHSIGDGWSRPVMVSGAGESGRAPAICAAAGGGVWVAWHSGVGDAMRVKALHSAAD
jgi:hypothetical protein